MDSAPQAHPSPTHPQHRPSGEGYDVDVIQLSDFRLPGGTTSSIAEEVRAQSEAGITTALIHAAGSITNYPNPWSTHIQRILDLPGVQIASPRSRLHARVLVIRHPTVIYSTRSTFDHISADHVIIVVNHAAVDAAGTWHYPVEATDARVRRLFGEAPLWAPIGPVVRGTVLDQTTAVPLQPEDWVNIFRTPEQLRRRTGFIGDKPVLGRHSRPQPGKWPATGKDILQAYPETSDYQVEILGGAKVAENKLGYVPKNWHVIPFGGEEPNHFLERIDFWVYMHHPDLKEAFGRAAMEALAAGCVAIMPPYLKELFGDAALYGAPKDVLGIVDEHYADREKFLAQSARAQDFARSFSPQMHIDRLAALGAHPAPTSAGAPRSAGAPDDPAGTTPRAHHGHGVTLVLAVGPGTAEQAEQVVAAVDGSEGRATGAPDHTGDRPVLIAQIADSSGEIAAPEVGSEDSHAAGQRQLVLSAAGLNAPSSAWQDHLRRRVQRLIRTHRPARVLVVGASVPPGVLAAFTRADVHRVWVRSPAGGPGTGSEAPAQSAPDPAVVASFHRVLTWEDLFADGSDEGAAAQSAAPVGAPAAAAGDAEAEAEADADAQTEERTEAGTGP